MSTGIGDVGGDVGGDVAGDGAGDVAGTAPPLLELRDIGRITFVQSLKGVKLVLWDEQARRLVSFREARATA